MPENSQQARSKYFAVQDAEQTASILLGKAQTFFNTLNSNDYIDKLNKMWKFYHGIFSQSSNHEVGFTGEQGELVTLPVNHFRNLAQHILSMITTNRPVMEARAINTDYKSLAQTYLANGILDYYMREKHLEDAIKKAVEMSIVLGAGFIKLEWNATSGEEYDADPETGEVNYEGELQFSNHSPLDVVVDGTKENWNHDWILVRSYQNKYNLMAKYPELADKINSIPSKDKVGRQQLSLWSNDETDDVAIYEFFHRRTEAVPEGRYLLFLDSDVVLLDTKLPYRVIPVFRVAPNDILGTPYGYTPMFDVFPIQEGINALYSTISTNQNAFGVQNIWVPKGADLQVHNLEGSLNVVESTVKPEPLNLTDTPAEIFKFLEMLIQAAETISGINSVTRGQPQSNLESGTALALVQSMAIQFISGLQQSYVKLIEDTGTAVIQILKDYANTPKTIALVGKNNRTYLKEFIGEQISSINRVVVDVGNPLSRTIGGRIQMADNLLQYQLIKSPQQYFQVLNTGRLDAMFEGEMSELLLIKQENERLMEGTSVRALALDNHKLHIEEHKSVLSDPDLRNDDALAELVLNHIQEHLNLLKNTDPELLMLTGQQPLQQQAPPQQAQQLPPAGAIDQNQIPGVVAPETGLVQPGEEISGPGVDNISLPNPPTPPAPFEDLPVLPGQVPVE